MLGLEVMVFMVVQVVSWLAMDLLSVGGLVGLDILVHMSHLETL
jgi:hypothetical protein